jgi:hypothetical protein
VALKTQELDALQVSWDGTCLSLWAFDGEKVESHPALRSLVMAVFGFHGLALLGPEVTPLYIPAPGDPVGDQSGRRVTYTQSLRAFDHHDYGVFRRMNDIDDASPSIRWVAAAVEVATAAARACLLSPQLTEAPLPEFAGYPALTGVRWEARWALRHNDEVNRAIERLDDVAPPALWAPFPGGRPAGATRAVVEHLADSAARWSLEESGWKADLGRSNRADMVVARRFAAALGDAPGVVADNNRAGAAAQALAVALDEATTSADAGVAFRSRARLRTPDEVNAGNSKAGNSNITDAGADGNGEGDQWKVTFEVVLLNDPSVTLPWSDLANGLVEEQTTAGGVTLTKAGMSAMVGHTAGVAARLAEQIPAFASLTAERGHVMLEVDEVAALLVDGVDRCAALGCPLLVPKELARRRVRMSGTATAQTEGGVSANLGQAMVSVDWALALGDTRLTEAEIAALAQSKSELVRLRGEWVRVEAGHVAGALEQLSKRQGKTEMTAADLLRLTATAQTGGTGDTGADGNGGSGVDDGELELLIEAEEGTQSADDWLGELLAGLPDDRLDEATEPEGFVGELRPYQRRAVGWLGFLGRLGLGGCLADDMGLGKTPTTLAHLVAHQGDRPSLVICPLSVVHNWQAEAEKFTPGLRVAIAHGTDRERGEAFDALLDEVDLVITTYGTLSRDVDTMAAHRWNIVVCDEAQAIKNHRTKAARAVRALETRQLVALTGTPVENRLTELWSILDAANRGSLGGVTWFRDTFATPIETKGDEGALAGMKRLTGPFVLRRTKADKSLVPDLPDKVEQVAWAQLTEEQAGLYQAVLDDFLAQMDRTDDDSADGPEPLQEMQRRGLVVATLTKLKQICNHPAHYLAAGGEEPGRLKGRSGKLNRFDELVTELLEADERALIFTQYRTMGDMLVTHLADVHQVDANFLHGGVSRKAREKMVTDFQAGDSSPLQIVSLKAGGTGLNLTAASRVIHYDRWWNPAVEDQATDRAWRIGQQSTVFVHKLVCRGTLEERIDELLRDKKALADSVVGSGEAWLTEMSTDELKGLFRLGAGAVGDSAFAGSGGSGGGNRR